MQLARTIVLLTGAALAIAAAAPQAGQAQETAEASADEVSEAIERLREEYTTALEVGDYERAEKATARALPLVKQQFGESTAEYAEVLAAHASTVEKVGHLGKAEPLHRRVLLLRKEVLGEQHPHTIESINGLAGNLLQLGRPAEAESLVRSAVVLSTVALGQDHPVTIASVGNLATTLDHLGKSEEAELLHRRALSVRMQFLGEKHPDTIVSLNNLASNLQDRGRSAEAEGLFRRALAFRTEVLGEDHPDTLISVNNLASVLEEIGRSADAEPLYRRALAANMKVLGDRHPTTMTSLSNLALNLDKIGQSAEAESLHRRALAVQVAELGENHPNTIATLNNLAANLRTLGRSAEAESLHRRALALNMDVLGEKHPDTIAILNNLAVDLVDLYRSSEAEVLYRRASAFHVEVQGKRHPAALRAGANFAWILLSQVRRAPFALDPARAAAEGWRVRRRAGGSTARDEGQLARDVREHQWYFELLADAAWSAAQDRTGDLSALREEAFGAVQDALAGRTGQAIALMAARHATEDAGSGLGVLARERQSLSDQWRATEQALTKALADGGPAAALKRDNLQKQLTALEAEMAQIDERLRKEAPDYFALTRPEPLDLASAQRLLEADEAALLVVPTEFGTHVMALTHRGIEWHRADLKAAEVAAAVEKLRQQLVPAGAGRSPINLGDSGGPRFDRSQAHDLYKQLVGPVAPALAGKKTVYVAAAGALSSLPFGVLVTAPPSGADDDPEALRRTSWFADAHALVQLPSLQSLQMIRRSQQAKAASGFAGFGDPVLRGTKASEQNPFGTGRSRDGGAIADLSQLRSLMPLPGTARELEQMRTALGAPPESVRLREKATEAAVKSSDLSQVAILALATHGLLAGEVDGAAEPGLVFTPPARATEEDDGLLTASEITSLRLNADWVILSACNTAAGENRHEGLSGLARAFFYAGTRSILASHWPVRDDVAARLTVATIEEQRKGVGRAEALQRAMRLIREDETNPSWAHPSAWAPFALVGEGR